MPVDYTILETMLNEAIPLASKIVTLTQDDKIDFLGYFCKRYVDKLDKLSNIAIDYDNDFVYEPEDMINFANGLAPEMALDITDEIRGKCLVVCGWNNPYRDAVGEEKIDEEDCDDDDAKTVVLY